MRSASCCCHSEAVSERRMHRAERWAATEEEEDEKAGVAPSAALDGSVLASMSADARGAAAAAAAGEADAWKSLADAAELITSCLRFDPLKLPVEAPAAVPTPLTPSEEASIMPPLSKRSAAPLRCADCCDADEAAADESWSCLDPDVRCCAVCSTLRSSSSCMTVSLTVAAECEGWSTLCCCCPSLPAVCALRC